MSLRGALFVIGAILFQKFWMGLAAALLSALLVIALALRARRHRPADP